MKKLIVLILVVVTTQCFPQNKAKDLGRYLKSFEISKNRGKNVITWTTKSEVGVAWFILEQSDDCIEYTGITVYGSGNLHKRAYEFMDGKHPGTQSYRLIIKDNKDNILDIQYYYLLEEVPKKITIPEEKFVKSPCQTRGFLLI